MVPWTRPATAVPRPPSRPDQLVPSTALTPPPDRIPTLEPTSLAFDAEDAGTGICRVELWWRHESASGWSAWTIGPTATASPFLFSPPAGPGSYEISLVGVDNAGNAEVLPSVPDAAFDAVEPAYSPAVMADSPVGYWRLGESAGSVADDAVGGPDATYQGPVALGVTGLLANDYDTAVRLDGSNAYVATAPGGALALGTTGRLTLEAWIQPTAGSGPGTIAARGTATNGYDYRLVWDDGVLAVTILTAAGATRVVAATGPAAAPPGAISHVVVTLDDTTDNIRFYVNGADVAMSSATWSGVSTVQAADALVVGRASDQAGAFFAGVIDEVAVYDSVLSPQRVAEHHSAGSIP